MKGNHLCDIVVSMSCDIGKPQYAMCHTSLKKNNKKQKILMKEKEEPFIILWLINITWHQHHNITQVLPWLKILVEHNYKSKSNGQRGKEARTRPEKFGGPTNTIELLYGLVIWICYSQLPLLQWQYGWVHNRLLIIRVIKS